MNNKNSDNSWKRMSFKGNKVWVQTDDSGAPDVQNGTVRIKYNLKQDYEYRVKLENLRPENEAVPAKKKQQSAGSKKSAPRKSASTEKNPQETDESDIPENCIKIYTDGASSGNPGPSGIGVLLIFGDKRKEISRYIGEATNNIAELSAIKTALEMLKREDLPVRIFSDSNYSIGLLTKGWKPKKNQELVADIRRMMEKFKDLKFIKVKGHAGIEENETADFLATSAIKKGL